MKQSFFDWREAGQWAREECDRTGTAMVCYSWRGEWLVFPAAHPLPPEQWRFEFSVHPAGELTQWEAVDAMVRPEGICRGCGGAKEYGCLVCWVCFKGERGDGVAPFKYFRPACDLNAWLVAIGRPPVAIDPEVAAASPWRRVAA